MPSGNEELPALVIPIVEWPQEDSGGPIGFTYLLPRALLQRGLTTVAQLYFLHSRNARLFKIDCMNDLVQMANDGRAEVEAANKVARQSMRTQLKECVKATAKSLGIVWVLPAFAREIRSISYRLSINRERKRHQERLQAFRGVIESLVIKHREVVCHGHHVEASHLALEACRSVEHVKILHTEHSKGGRNREILQLFASMNDEQRREIEKFDRFYQELIRDVTNFTFPSLGALELFESHNGKFSEGDRNRVLVVYSGLDILSTGETSVGPSSTTPHLFAIAKHVPEKGIDRMILAIASLKARKVFVKLRVAGGETNLTPALLKLRKQHNVCDEVEFLGAVPNSKILEEIKAASIFLACPLVVVFDLSILEAMAAGKAIITTRLLGNIEALGEDYEGLFASDEELPNLLLGTASSADNIMALGRRNRERYEQNFTMQMMAERYVNVYLAALK